MGDIAIVTIIIIAANALVSYKGFNDFEFLFVSVCGFPSQDPHYSALAQRHPEPCPGY